MPKQQMKQMTEANFAETPYQYTIDQAFVLRSGKVIPVLDEERAELIADIEAGRVEGIELQIVAFKAEYPNSNGYRFRDGDLDGFGLSYVGQPFLRDHATGQIENRDGKIEDSAFVGIELAQTIKLTTRRGMLSYVEGQIDRFSIGWFWEGVTCSVCGQDWFSWDCSHWPLNEYEVKDEDGNKQTVLCELIFEGPRGKETSAVNTPAVDGTGVLSNLLAQKEVILMSSKNEVHAEKLAAAKASETNGANENSGGEQVDVMAQLADLTANHKSLTDEVERLRSLADERAAALAVSGHDEPADQGRIEVGSHLDEVGGAMDWIFGVEDAEMPEPELRRIDNLYRLITGDREWHGVYQPEFALAAATTTTLASMAVNAMNKVLIEHWAALTHYRWFEPIVSVQPNDGSVQDMQWITFGGIGDLPTVAEGAAYTELTVDDAKESDSFVKKGGYVGITLEMIRNSQIQKIQMVPRALAIAAVRTRSTAIGNIFNSASGVGPTLSDTKALFHADHGNLATTAFSTAAWKAARTAMMKQTELHSSKRIMLTPAFWLGPADLYDDALREFGYGAGPGGRLGDGSSDDADINIYGASRPGDPRPVPIAVPEFTDANDWAFIADPKLWPVIVMSYANSPGGRKHPRPELFSVTSPTSGLQFTNDVLPIKARDWFAAGVADYRGIGKRNVA